MKKAATIVMFALVGLALIISTGCKRNAVEEPGPFGPTGLSLLLRLNTTPNVIFAGETTREYVTVDAKLEKYTGAALSGETIQFQVQDAYGIRVNMGYFEGNESVASRVTDGNGNISLRYYGPLAQEIGIDAQLYVTAIVAWQGSEYITEIAPIYVVRDVTDVVFTFVAQPNVLWCTKNRPQSTLRATFRKSDGAPLINRKVFFQILKGTGNFTGNKTKTFAMTNDQGVATIQYIAPKGADLTRDDFVQIQGQPETYSPFYIHEELEIRLIKGG